MSCPLCGRKFKTSLAKDTRYWYCTQCTLAKRKKFSHASYADEYYSASSFLARRLFLPIERLFYFLRTGYVGQTKRNLWIDVGAGDGGYLQTVPAREKIGVEISKPARERMKRVGIHPISDQQFLQMRGREADIISFWHVLEHIDAPWKYLAAAQKNLASDGRIVVAVPNIESLEYRLFGNYWFHLVPQYHLWHFTPKSIRKLLHQQGFRIVKINYWSVEHHPTGILQTFINVTSGTEAALQKLVKRADGGRNMNVRAIFWSIFWLTFGAPLVIIFWFVQVALKRSGTIVIVARKIPR